MKSNYKRMTVWELMKDEETYFDLIKVLDIFKRRGIHTNSSKLRKLFVLCSSRAPIHIIRLAVQLSKLEDSEVDKFYMGFENYLFNLAELSKMIKPKEEVVSKC